MLIGAGSLPRLRAALLAADGDLTYGDMATPAGSKSGRMAAQGPLPNSPAGALVGRIGNGQPFPIGDARTAFDMSDNGRLFLGINDDHVADNSGNYVVRVWEP